MKIIVMIPVIIAVIVTFFASVVLVLMVKLMANQNIMCPHCKLEFVTDLFLIGNSGLVACPFCHQWISVTKSSGIVVVKKLFI